MVVCDLYAQARSLQEQGVHLGSTDEKTGIQAREDAHPSLPLQPGQVECREMEYIRHGTQCLIANFEVATGRLLTPSIGPTRTEEDFRAHIAQTIAPDPAGTWILIVDQPGTRWVTHQSESLVRLLLRRGSFVSVEDLRQRILAFIDYFNATMAKPFKWTYTGRPLAA